MLAYERIEYRGKHYTVPKLSPKGMVIEPQEHSELQNEEPDTSSPIIQKLNSVWDLDNFRVMRKSNF